MPISDYCNRNVICLDRSETIQKASKLMRERHLDTVIVIDANNRKIPIGILEDADIVTQIVAENLPLTTKVNEIMSTAFYKIKKDVSLESAIDMMEEKEVSKLIVTNKADNVNGLISADDILRIIAKETNELANLVGKELYKKHELQTPTRRNLI